MHFDKTADLLGLFHIFGNVNNADPLGMTPFFMGSFWCEVQCVRPGLILSPLHFGLTCPSGVLISYIRGQLDYRCP